MSTIVAAVGIGVIVLLAGNLPWAGFGPIGGLARMNLRIGTALPWAMLPMALYLWVYWTYLRGRWGDPRTASSRRATLRANALTPAVWRASLGAGVLGFGALLALLAVAARVVQLPASSPIATPPEMPVVTALVLLVMQSIVAGVTEEAAFRGYMQSLIERRHGVVLAIVVNGVFFGLLHFGNHPADVLMMLPYYVAVSAVYGGLTWAADSILPALVLHVVGDVVVLTRWWATGLPEWQVATTPPRLVWDGGLDASAVVAAIAFVVLAVLTALAYGAVRRMRPRAVTPPVQEPRATMGVSEPG
jgi:membrane protease YdiL (CAAX protease family)